MDCITVKSFRSCRLSLAGDPFRRHTPQTKFVTLMKGMNDVPVCTVSWKESLDDLLPKKQGIIDNRLICHYRDYCCQSLKYSYKKL